VGFLRSATGLLCCLVIAMAVVAVIGIRRSRQQDK
jgi:hypothetical protein